LANGSSNSDGDSDDGDVESPGNELVDDLETGSIDSFLPTCGQEGVYSSRCPGWHFYTTTNLVCPAELQCTAEEMKDYLLRFAYPGQDPSQPVVSGNSYSVGFPYTHLSMGPLGAIVVSVENNGFTSINTTLSTHVLDDGKAIRNLYQGDDGAWYVTTYGFGNNRQFYVPVAEGGIKTGQFGFRKPMARSGYFQ
jgi:hypothetical protein